MVEGEVPTVSRMAAKGVAGMSTMVMSVGGGTDWRGGRSGAVAGEVGACGDLGRLRPSFPNLRNAPGPSVRRRVRERFENHRCAKIRGRCARAPGVSSAIGRERGGRGIQGASIHWLRVRFLGMRDALCSSSAISWRPWRAMPRREGGAALPHTARARKALWWAW